MNLSLTRARTVALIIIAALVIASSLTSFGESYRNLFLFFREQSLPAVLAALAPLMIDTFIAVGELALFVGLIDTWDRKDRLGAWTVIAAGLAISVAGNVLHVSRQGFVPRASAAIPPVAAAAALAVGLGVLKRVVARQPEMWHVSADQTVPVPVPDAPEIQVPDVPALEVPGHTVNGHGPDGSATIMARFATDLAAGRTPSIRQIRDELGCGQPKATQIQRYIKQQAHS